VVPQRRRIRVGGEATIFFGTASGNQVAIREIHPPDEGDWSSPAGQRTLKARANCVEAVVHVS
jgi:hypothetical protein